MKEKKQKKKNIQLCENDLSRFDWEWDEERKELGVSESGDIEKGTTVKERLELSGEEGWNKGDREE